MLGLNFWSVRNHFPSWFGPIFLIGLLVFLSMICHYLWRLLRTSEIRESLSNIETKWLWFLLVISVPCTSALHKFYPFRMDIVSVWPELSWQSHFLKYNFILTASSLAILIIFMVLYFANYRQVALTGIVILSMLFLIANDDCPNDFNLPWIRWMGGSPLMFMPNSVVLLMGYCGLHGIMPRIGILFMSLINAGVLLLGIGHLTQVVW